jgi:hypothetical protein
MCRVVIAPICMLPQTGQTAPLGQRIFSINFSLFAGMEKNRPASDIVCGSLFIIFFHPGFHYCHAGYFLQNPRLLGDRKIISLDFILDI